jgi:hypothetical protein
VELERRKKGFLFVVLENKPAEKKFCDCFVLCWGLPTCKTTNIVFHF